MKRTVKVVIDGTARTLDAEKGELLPAVLGRNGLSTDMPCGGKGLCKNCPVFIDGKACLVCQTRVETDMQIELGSGRAIQKIIAGDVVSAPPVNPMFTQYGVAADIGTTTICATLLDRDGGSVTVTRKNPQTAFGADVISRIEHALSGGANALALCVRKALSEMIVELCQMRGIGAKLVDTVVITGNTVMLYLLTEQDPASLSRAPFAADHLFGEFIDAAAFAFPISPNACIYLPQCISAFVGGDITCAILASGMCVPRKTTLLVDIGTNGEIALWHGNRLTCCSTAVGPAFEGAGISHGMYGANGAIDHIWQENGVIRYSTIGGNPVRGICGSGMIDAIALMLEQGIIDETGAFSDFSDWFALENGIGITGADVRQIQLAKAAVRAGIETLLESEGVKQSEVERLYIAGGFGNLTNLKNAAKIGLFPVEMTDRVAVIGNAAHIGAAMLLCDNSLVNTLTLLLEQAHTISLDSNPVFTNHYVEYMMF